MNLLVIGDVAFASNETPSCPWMPLTDTVIGAETRVLFNWELPVGDSVNPVPRTSGPRLISARDSVDVLCRWAPGYATLATNHILDAGSSGLCETLSSLREDGFTTVGAGLTRDEIAKPLWWETSVGVLAVINWVFPETHPDWNSVPGPNCWPGAECATQTVQEVKRDADWVLCIVHWSDENFAYPRPEDRSTGTALIRAGADCVIGHHPHVVRGRELVDGSPIFYSVGNFFFADVADGHGGWVCREAPRNREGLGVLIRMRTGEKPIYEIRSFWNEGDGTIPDRAHRAQRRMAHSSYPLKKFTESAYREWYAARRARFDRWFYRWHFGIRRLGFRATVMRAVRKSAIGRGEALT